MTLKNVNDNQLLLFFLLLKQNKKIMQNYLNKKNRKAQYLVDIKANLNKNNKKQKNLK